MAAGASVVLSSTVVAFSGSCPPPSPAALNISASFSAGFVTVTCPPVCAGTVTNVVNQWFIDSYRVGTGRRVLVRAGSTVVTQGSVAGPCTLTVPGACGTLVTSSSATTFTLSRTGSNNLTPAGFTTANRYSLRLLSTWDCDGCPQTAEYRIQKSTTTLPNVPTITKLA